ncbi:hypothetical protein AJ79_09955, partial [Helicocarpus griseus UAMH5409]
MSQDQNSTSWMSSGFFSTNTNTSANTSLPSAGSPTSPAATAAIGSATGIHGDGSGHAITADVVGGERGSNKARMMGGKKDAGAGAEADADFDVEAARPPYLH